MPVEDGVSFNMASINIPVFPVVENITKEWLLLLNSSFDFKS